MTGFRWLAFGDVDATVWGTAWVPEGAGHGRAVLGTDDAARLVDVEPDGDSGRLVGEGVELRLPVPSSEDGEGFEPLERVEGSFSVAETERSVEARGWALSLTDAGALDSVRLVAGWYEGGEALALASLRPAKARGQEDDRLITALIDGGEAQEVTDSRLSTTYSGAGVPVRAGVELWISEPSEEPGIVNERPHRVAGAASGPGETWSSDGLELTAQPFRWHSHGHDGAGVYVLGRT